MQPSSLGGPPGEVGGGRRAGIPRLPSITHPRARLRGPGAVVPPPGRACRLRPPPGHPPPHPRAGPVRPPPPPPGPAGSGVTPGVQLRALQSQATPAREHLPWQRSLPPAAKLYGVHKNSPPPPQIKQQLPALVAATGWQEGGRAESNIPPLTPQVLIGTEEAQA